MSDKTVNAVSQQPVKTENSRMYRSTPYEHVSTISPVAAMKRVGKSISVGTTITKKPFTATTRDGR